MCFIYFFVPPMSVSHLKSFDSGTNTIPELQCVCNSFKKMTSKNSEARLKDRQVMIKVQAVSQAGRTKGKCKLENLPGNEWKSCVCSTPAGCCKQFIFDCPLPTAAKFRPLAPTSSGDPTQQSYNRRDNCSIYFSYASIVNSD